MGHKKQKARKTGSPSTGKRHSQPNRLALPMSALTDILERAKVGALSAEDVGHLSRAVETLAFLTAELERKDTSIHRLRKLLFGASTERLRNVQGEQPETDMTADGNAVTSEEASGALEGTGPDETDGLSAPAEAEKRRGHGRNGARDFKGAVRIAVPHEQVKAGEVCSACDKGKTYPVKEPSTLLRIEGMAPLCATVYELSRLRCNLCGQVFTAKPPDGVGYQKYDESAAAMVALLKYGCGVPFSRIERLEKSLGIPLPSATQWKLVEEGAQELESVWEALLDEAANGTVVHNDDTTMRVLEKENLPPPEEVEDGERTGVFTSGIVSVGAGRQIALFFTGRRHAGENLREVLARRRAELSAPVQMCDALSRNTKGLGAAGNLETVVGNCLAHGRRKFVEVAEHFPDECLSVLEKLACVYHHDAQARERELTPEARLLHHQTHSGPLMTALKASMEQQFSEKRVEPNSGLGEAFRYMLKHWEELTLFLRVAGAPLDNNLCERALKKAILHRKNSLFYKTANGARVGDLYMALIHTSELNAVNPFDYLVALLRHPRAVREQPANWLPWNYQQTLAQPAVTS